jgi:hypothetical protein
VALACVALAACAGIALVSTSGSESELVQRRVVHQQIRQQSTYKGLPVAVATPLDTRSRPKARRQPQQQELRAGGAGPDAPKQANAPRIPPKTETEKQAIMRARIEAKQAVCFCVCCATRTMSSSITKHNCYVQ